MLGWSNVNRLPGLVSCQLSVWFFSVWFFQ